MGKKIDLTGQRFGSLVVISCEERRRNNRIFWKCLCDCGNIHCVDSQNLRYGLTKSCGCGHKRTKFNDLEGKRFGRISVVRETNERRDGRVVWECICDCGNKCFVVGRNLTSGTTMSCGCFGDETIARRHLWFHSNINPSHIPKELILLKVEMIKINRELRRQNGKC